MGKVLLEEALAIEREYYLSLSLDRTRGCPVVIASSQGGMEIEQLSRAQPEAIQREWGDAREGVLPFQARRILSRLEVPSGLTGSMAGLILALGSVFVRVKSVLSITGGTGYVATVHDVHLNTVDT